jgi:cobalamin synthase
MKTPAFDAVAHPTTTAEQDRKTLGQRRINGIWEITQSLVALSVTGTTLYAASHMISSPDLGKTAFIFLTNVFFVVIGFYFGRTNHQRTGGVGGDSAGSRS